MILDLGDIGQVRVLRLTALLNKASAVLFVRLRGVDQDTIPVNVVDTEYVRVLTAVANMDTGTMTAYLLEVLPAILAHDAVLRTEQEQLSARAVSAQRGVNRRRLRG